MKFPVCASYGGQWWCPQMPTTDDGWALVLMLCTPLQVQAGKQDPRVQAMPQLFDPTPVAKQVTDTYAHLGATAGMSMGALIATLADAEPAFAHNIGGVA